MLDFSTTICGINEDIMAIVFGIKSFLENLLLHSKLAIYGRAFEIDMKVLLNSFMSFFLQF